MPTPKQAVKKTKEESALSSGLEEHRREVSYDTYDMLIRQLVDLVVERFFAALSFHPWRLGAWPRIS
jgi:hypothetical protein